MSSDRARDSYDPSRQYRSVVAQQGRVTLEADVNEAQRIAAENVRAETLDIVGPCGTPDDGYAVGGGKQPPDFLVGAGTMYAGGLRVTLPNQVDYAHQSEWLDQKGDPLWMDEQKVGLVKSEFVYLFLREQEVGAVEDVPLREVALGGPDSAQRTRLIQRFVRLPVEADQCAPALTIAKQKWSGLGVEFDEKTMRLKSPATLRVQFVQQPVAEGPCDPQVQGGYLGADNQLIRVQITGYDAKTNTGRFVWSYNNASFLYRAGKVDTQTVQLVSAPIDAYHTPGVTRAVEILRSAVDLKSDNYIAAHSGFVTTPAQAYVPETKQLALTTALPAQYLDPTGPLFLRLWEAESTFTPGQPADLAGTGLQVVIELNGKFGALTVGQFWFFAVRPSTPVNLYPQRYFDAPQPPEGPRLWACPLAVIGWAQEKFALLEDCRQKLDNLVELTKRRGECCSIVVTPADVGGGAKLQELIDSVAGKKATVSLQPGLYELPAPLILDKKHSALTLEGCHDGAVLAAKAAAENEFLAGLVQMTLANDVTLRRLRFHLPLAKQLKPLRGLPVFAGSFGVLAVHCADLRIEECLFRFRLAQDMDMFAAGVFATSESWNLRVERNRFLHDDEYDRNTPVTRRMVGVMAATGFPGIRSAAAGRRAFSASRKILDGIPVLLENACIIGNEFAGLTVAVYARAQMGRVRCEDNFAHGCDAGFYFTDADQALLRAIVLQVYRPKFRNAAEEGAFAATLQAAQVPIQLAMHDFAIRVPLPAGYVPPYLLKVGKAPDATTAKALTAQAKSAHAQLLAAFRAGATKPASDAAAKDRTGGAGKPTAAAPAVTVNSALIRAKMAPLLAAFPREQPVVRHIPDLHFTGNDVEILPERPNEKEPLRAPPLALYVALAAGQDASVMVTANHLRAANANEQIIAAIQHPTTAAVTGNMVLNTVPSSRSLLLTADPKNPLVSVSGNAFRGGDVIVPPKPSDAGCSAGNWHDLNSLR